MKWCSVRGCMFAAVFLITIHYIRLQARQIPKMLEPLLRGGSHAQSTGVTKSPTLVNTRRADAKLPKQAQVGPDQVQAIFKALPHNGSMLVWGLGYDSPFWHNVTEGNVVFLENNAIWYNKVMSLHPHLESYQVSYSTHLTQSWNQYHGHPELWKGSLLVGKFPADLWERHWDVILVDAPLGCCAKAPPGRYQSIYTSHQLVEKQLSREGAGVIHVFVDDYDRHVERDFSREVFGREPVEVVSRGGKRNQQAHFIFGNEAINHG